MSMVSDGALPHFCSVVSDAEQVGQPERRLTRFLYSKAGGRRPATLVVRRQQFSHGFARVMYIEAISDPFDLQPLAASIRRSSNFRFAWQFYSVSAAELNSLAAVAEILGDILTQPVLHSFLANSLDEISPRKFQIEPLHQHASIVRDGASFLDTMARASLDRLGAYSPDHSCSTAEEREPIHKLFSRMGQYTAFALDPGMNPACHVCQQRNSHLFSNWFFGVAWDYIFLLSWSRASLFWMGCLTDTD